MSILPALQSAALRLYGRRPNQFFGSSEQFEAELCDWANEVAHDISQRNEWQALTKVQTFSGNGEVTEYDFPADYDRQLLRSDVVTSNSYPFGYFHIPDINEFLAVKQAGFTGYPGVWTIYGGKMHVSPAPGAGVHSHYPYISKNWAKDANGNPKDQFTADTDSFVLSNHLLTLGIVWRWRENKKLDYTADLEAFNEHFSLEAAKDKGSRIIRRNSRLMPYNTYPAFPWSLGPSTYLDS